MRRLLTALLLTGILLTGVVTVSATDAGGAGDPLVSRSYAESWASSLVETSFASSQSSMEQLYQAAKRHLDANPPEASGSAAVSFSSGDVITLRTGSSITVLSGVARVAVASGAIVNVTVGATAGNGRLNANQLYLCCDGTSAAVTMSSDGSALIDGPYSLSAAPIVFSDVLTTDWFYSDVYKAVGSGLIDGVSATSFSPNTNLTLAQAIKLSACMHELDKTGKVTLASGDGVWYAPFVEYAVREGIIEQSYASLPAARYGESVTRAEYIHIFYKALPESGYTKLNTVSDGAIPDVPMTHQWSAEIYAFYRAGILSGYEGGYFKPGSDIARREVAAVLTRMLDATARQSFTLE